MAYKTMAPNGRSITTPVGFSVTLRQPPPSIIAVIGLVGLPIVALLAAITFLNTTGRDNKQLLRR